MKTAAKDFKMTELGPIPKDWDVKRLGDCCSITTGHKDVNEGCENGHFPFFTCSRDVYRANCYSFDGEAILVAGNGDVGNLHYCNGKFEAYQRTYVLMNFKIDTQYLWCELGANLMERLTDGKIGTSIPYIVLGQLQDYMFALPPLPEQRKIAAALSDVDEMIAALEKLIEKKRKIKTGAMQRLLTGKTRLPGFKGAWVEKRLGEVVEMCTNTIAINQINVREYVGTENMLTNRQGVKGFEDQLPYVNVREYRTGDILISNIRPYLKKIWLADRNGGCSTDVLVLRSNTRDVEPSFLYSVLCDDSFFDFVMANAVGTKMPRGDKKVIGDYVLRCPPTLAEQKAIAKVLGDMDEEIAALEAELAKTRQLKQGMMQELLTGKTRLV